MLCWNAVITAWQNDNVLTLIGMREAVSGKIFIIYATMMKKTKNFTTVCDQRLFFYISIPIDMNKV